jgi:predicted  nucleic acid-binding Zn-ribbon protein
VATTIDRVAASLRAKSTEARKRYREILGSLADDPEAELNDLEKVLTIVGKSPDQLRQDVATLLERRKAAGVLAGTDPELQELIDREQAARAEKEAAEARIEELRKVIQKWDSAETARVVAEERWRHSLSLLSGEKARARTLLNSTADAMTTENEKLDPIRLRLW